MNFEPVSSIFFGMIILGQFLEPFQLAGACLRLRGNRDGCSRQPDRQTPPN